MEQLVDLMAQATMVAMLLAVIVGTVAIIVAIGAVILEDLEVKLESRRNRRSRR